jgi:hypothetical protein
MRCDSWATLLTRTIANLCLGREPKVTVVTSLLIPFQKQDKQNTHIFSFLFTTHNTKKKKKQHTILSKT